MDNDISYIHCLFHVSKIIADIIILRVITREIYLFSDKFHDQFFIHNTVKSNKKRWIERLTSYRENRFFIIDNWFLIDERFDRVFLMWKTYHILN